MTNEKITCPYCKEDIKADAIKCKHCHSRIKPEVPEHHGVCPFCKEEIKTEAVKCKHCKSKLDMTTVAHTCDCFTQPLEPSAPYLRRPSMSIRDYGQGCFYDCMDRHADHGDDMSDPRIHRYCESQCRISMPRTFFGSGLFARY